MIETIRTQDGQIGYSASAPPLYIVATASAGPFTVQTFGDASQIRGTFPTGDLPDRASLAFTLPGIGATALLRMGQSIAGSVSTPDKTPASTTGTPLSIPGSYLHLGADADGDLLIKAKVPAVILTTAAGGSSAWTLVGGQPTLTVHTGDSGTVVAALSLTAVASVIISVTALGSGASNAGTAAGTVTMDNGTLTAAALVGGALLVGATNAGVIFYTPQSGVSVAVLTGATPGVYQNGDILEVTITSGTTTAAQEVTLVNGTAAAVALGITAQAYGDGTGNAALQSVALLAPLQFVLTVAGNSTAEAISMAGSTITIASSTNVTGEPTGTATNAAAKIAAPYTALMTLVAGGSGAGLATAKSATVLAFGSTGVLTASGNPLQQYNLQVVCVRSGGRGVGTFQYSLDDLPTLQPETLIPGAGVYVIPGTGVTITFSNDTFAAGDFWAIPVVAAQSSTTDLNNALTALSGLTGQGGDLHMSGAMSGAQATVITSWIATERVSGRVWVCLINSRDYLPGETDTAFVAAVDADYASVLEPNGRLWGVPQNWDTVIPNQGISRRPFAWAAGMQVQSIPTYANPVCIEDGGGPIPNLFTPQVPIQPATHDERLNPGLGGSGGRWATVQSLPGAPGFWYLGDAGGDRSPGTFAAGTSDWSLLMNARLGALTERLLLQYGPKLLGTRYDTIAPGRTNAGALTTAERRRIEGKLSKFLSKQLGLAVSGPVIVAVSSSEPIKTSKILRYTVTLPTWAYALRLDGTIGLQ